MDGNAGDQEREKQGRSVEHLQELYTVVVAIALSLVVAQLIPAPGGDVTVEPFLLSAALLVTLIPFYHGALRHLDEQYSGTDARGARGFVLVDFLVLFLESCLFLALAVSIARPEVFVWLFFALLALDVVWVVLTSKVLGDGSGLAAQRMWRNINLVAAVVLLLASLTVDVGSLSYLILAVALARTGADYGFTWRYYAAST